MFQIPVDVGGVSVRRDVRDDRWRMDHETGTYTLRPWRWSERHRLIRACMVDGALQRRAFMTGLMDLLVQPGLDTEAAPFWTVLCLQLLEVPEAADVPSLSHGELLFARHFGWRPADLEDQPAADLDRLLGQLAGPRQPGQPGPEIRREGEWTSIVFNSDARAVGAWRSRDVTARLEALLDTVARWGGVTVGDEDSARHGESGTAPAPATVRPGTGPDPLSRQAVSPGDSFPAATADSPAQPREGESQPEARTSPGPGSSSLPPHTLPGVARLRAPGPSPAEHGMTDARAGVAVASMGEARGDSVTGTSTEAARTGSPAPPDGRLDSGHGGASRIDEPTSPPWVPQPVQRAARPPAAASGPEAAAVFPSREAPAGRAGRLKAMAVALAEAQRDDLPGPVPRNAGVTCPERRAPAVEFPADFGGHSTGSMASVDRAPWSDHRDGNVLGSPGSWPESTGMPDPAPAHGMSAPDQASDPFAESAFEERLADVLADAAREAGIDLP